MPSSAAAAKKFCIFFSSLAVTARNFSVLDGGGWNFLMIFPKNLLVSRNFRTKKGTVIAENFLVRI
jgi:hypothetical protein